MTPIKSMLADPHRSAGTLYVQSAFDRTPLAVIETADAAAVEQALSTAYALFRNRALWLSKIQRLAILEKTVGIMQLCQEDLALVAAREGGKPLFDSRVEVQRAIESVQLCIDCLRHDAGQGIAMGINKASADKLACTVSEPVGVVVAISAFNHPLNLIAHQVGPALANGCPVIVKPAASTPLSCYRFVAILREAGLPDAWCQALVTDNNATAEKLACDARVAFVSFIGSARVGWMLRSKLAPGTRCALEHGGVAPVIVARDADVDAAIPKLLKGGFYHAGQVCVSVQRVYAERSIAVELAKLLGRAACKLTIGDPVSPQTQVGPLISPAEVERVASWVDDAVAEGAQLICGGERLSETCYACTVLLNPASTSKVSTHEIFGPVICVYTYDALDQAISAANSLPYAFQAAVFTRDIDVAMQAYRHLDASAVMLNDHTAFRVDWMPFAGLRESGLGIGGIPYTYHDMQIQKMLVLDSPTLR